MFEDYERDDFKSDEVDAFELKIFKRVLAAVPAERNSSRWLLGIDKVAYL
jgi:hypothetical protein